MWYRIPNQNAVRTSANAATVSETRSHFRQQLFVVEESILYIGQYPPPPGGVLGDASWKEKEEEKNCERKRKNEERRRENIIIGEVCS